jgi:2-keto-3-deoxy-L-rhamnonate aldolase RhmA
MAPGRPLIGSNLVNRGAEWTELCGHAGFDFVCIDQMVSATDWRETGEMLRGAAAGRTSGWVRLSAYPWGGDDQRGFLRRDVLKAMAIGAEAILASVDNPADAAALLEMPQSHARHRKYAVRGKDVEGIVPEGAPTIIPLIESEEALAGLDGFASLPGLEAVFLGTGDLARLKGIPADATDARMARMLGEAVDVCSRRGVAVMCSIGKSDMLKDALRRFDILREIGVRGIWLPNPAHIAFAFYRAVVSHA